MGIVGFEELWRQQFADIPPVGFLLRQNLPENWARFHALPLSKRYADTEDETAIILNRANSLMRDLFVGSNEIWLASSRPDQAPNTISYEPQRFVEEKFNLPRLFSWQDPTDEPDARATWSTCADRIPWRNGCLDQTFKKIADEEEYGIILTSHDMKTVLAPYDGGFDLIIFDSHRKHELVQKYLEWLSPRDDKL
ncbi:MAG: hypothetical protein ABJN22_07720 [Litorimonas sp.]